MVINLSLMTINCSKKPPFDYNLIVVSNLSLIAIKCGK